jgi:hypothetical protein
MRTERELIQLNPARDRVISPIRSRQIADTFRDIPSVGYAAKSVIIEATTTPSEYSFRAPPVTGNPRCPKLRTVKLKKSSPKHSKQISAENKPLIGSADLRDTPGPMPARRNRNR